MKILQPTWSEAVAGMERTEFIRCRQSIVPAPNVSSKKYADAVHAGHRIRAGLFEWNSLRGVAVEVMVVENENAARMRSSNEPRVTAPAGRSSESW